VAFAGRDLQFHTTSNFFSHDLNFSTCKKSNSTGVARPKIVTSTRSVLRSGFTSSTLPEKFAKRPVVDAHVFVLLETHLRTRTVRRACLAYNTEFHFIAVSGTGELPPPRNPVTRESPSRRATTRRSCPSRPARSRIKASACCDLLAFRSSTTSSVGIRIWPIWSANPNASARLLSELATFAQTRIGVDNEPLFVRKGSSAAGSSTAAAVSGSWTAAQVALRPPASNLPGEVYLLAF